MGRTTREKTYLRKEWIQELKVANIMKIDGAKIICSACETGFNFGKKSELQQHVSTQKHRKLTTKFLSNPHRQLLMSEAVESQPNKEFNVDLCRAFISAGIPWNKLNNPQLDSFLTKYTGKSIPDESTIRKNYLPKVYGAALDEIRRDIGVGSIWLSVDETTDKCGRYIANVIIGTLRKDESTKAHLVSSSQLDKTNNITITKCVLDTFQLLWPGIKQEEVEKRFLLFLTDGVEYMIKAGKNLKELYGKLLHVTCVVHGINRVAEEIRSLFPDVDKFVSNMKTAFKKAPSRIAIYKSKYPALSLPPDPVLTRWGTWLSAAEFYANHFIEIKDIIENLVNDSAAINTLKDLVQSQPLLQSLTFLSLNYTFLAGKITEMEERGASLQQSLQYLDDIEDRLFVVRGTTGKKIIEKFKSIIGKNPDFDKLKTISSILQGEDVDQEDVPIGLNPSEMASLKFAPVTSVDAERSFSMHKFLLSDRRRNLTPANLEMELVSHFELLHEA